MTRGRWRMSGNVSGRPSAMGRMTRWLIPGMAAILLAGCTSSIVPPGRSSPCSAGSPSGQALIPIRPSGATTRVSCGGITFGYPAGWYRTAASYPSSFTDMVAAVSNQPIHDPCTTSGNTITCAEPLNTLDTGGLLVEWWVDGFPQWSLAKEPGTPTTIDGLQARMQQHSGSSLGCPAGLGAQISIRVAIARTAPGNYFELDACARGPDQGLAISTAMAILHSATFAQP